MASNSDGGSGSNGTLTRSVGLREYDTLKQYDELSNSRRICDHHLNDLDYYRDQQRALMNQLEVSSQDSATLRTKYTELMNENKQLQQQNQTLLKELAEHTGNGSEALFMSHTQALSKLEVAQDENARLAKQCKELDQERGVAQRDTMALRQKMLKIYKDYQCYKQQYEEVSIKAKKEIKRLTEERNAAMVEYNLIMSERDTVHRDMEKLSDDLQQAVEKIKILDADNKELQEDKRNLNYQLESLRREIASALHERDKAIKECNDLREKFGATSESGRLIHDGQMKKSRALLIDSFSALGDVSGCKEHLRGDDARSIISQRQRLDNLDQANQELESLRKSLDKAQTELAEAVQEAEVSKGRRDWAFSERDKIVQERESIRTLCDNMRKERDRAISDLVNSVRESDAMKKQRNELAKDVKALREALEAHLEREQRLEQSNQDCCCAHTEVIELELSPGDDEGLELAGGRDFPGDGTVYVASVLSGSSASGILFPYDRILRVNDVDCTQASLRMVTEAIRSSMPVARILVKRRVCARKEISTNSEQVTKWIHTASLAPACHGLSLKMGVYINRISEGSLAARDKSLTVGDRVLKINDKSMDDVKNVHEAMQVLNDDTVDMINITTLKMSYPECPNVFTPVRRHNRCSQTEEKNNSSAWFKFDIVRGRRKEDKKKYPPNTQIDYDGQEEAIATLDRVLIDHSCGTTKRSSGTSKRIHSKEEKNNGGTWPKARVPPILHGNGGGGTVIGRPKKERPPLSLPKDPNNYLTTSTPMPEMPPTLPVNRRSNSIVEPYNTPHPFDSLDRLPSHLNRLSVNIISDNSMDFSVPRFDKELTFKKPKPLKYPESEPGSILSGLPTETIHNRVASGPFQRIPPYGGHPHPPRDTNCYIFEPIHQTHTPSIELVGNIRRPPPLDHHHSDNDTNFLRKGGPRIRIPSNPSVTTKLSTGSIERGSSERGSPMPIFHVELLSSPGDHSGTSYKPEPGDIRRVHIDKSNEPLGIQIGNPGTGGIFVSSVNANSLASRVGLQVGDQLLEVCGINMRNATYNLAATVLRQCGKSITMLVQYNPEKCHELEGGSGSCSGSTSNDEDDDDEDDGDGEATPCNSPKEVRKTSSLQMKPSPLSVLQRQSPAVVSNSSSSRGGSEEPRRLVIETLKTSNLGISLVGGNAAGIFIHSVHSESLAYHAGLRTGDQILEYNGSDLRNATAEEAAYELAKPADKVTVLAQYRIDKYNEIKDKPGDSLYVRCGFDNSGNDRTEPPQLAFCKDDVLYVDNTMFNGAPGQWRAWRLDSEGHRQQCGVIPSKYKVEEDILLRRGAGDTVDGRSTATARRSFFRRKKNQRAGSSGTVSSSGGLHLANARESKELAIFCNMSPSWYSDSGSLHEDLSQCSYQRVERLQYPEYRPVLVLGPLAECVVDKLVQDFPEKFQRANTETRRCPLALVERELAEGLVVEYRRRGSCFECTTVTAVRAVAQNGLHCMLDGSISIVERLHRHHIYPMVLLIKFKSTKQIKEVKDARYNWDKLSGKAAKEMFEHGNKLETEHRNLVTTVVSAGANVKHVCAQVKAAIESEYRKSQWVPVSHH